VANYDPFAPWNTPGWTPLNGVPLVTNVFNNNPPDPDWPVDLSIVTVTGNYRDALGYPVQGIVRFRRFKQVSVQGTILTPGETIGTVEDGVLTVDLPASDDPDASEAFVYKVKECFAGGREYNIVVPFDVTTADITNLVVEEDDDSVTSSDLTALHVTIGLAYDREFGYQLANGDPVPGLDLYTARFQVRATLNSPTLLDIVPAFDYLTGIITLGLTDVQTATLTSGTFLYGLILEDGVDTIPVLEGNLVATLPVVQ